MLRTAEPPEHAGRRHVALGEFLLRAFKRRWRGYRKESKRCRKKFSEDSIHQLRVAIRRLRSLLSLLATVIPGDHHDAAERLLKKRFKICAPLRDTHVQLLYVAQLRHDFPAATRYYDALDRRECRLIKRTRRKLARPTRGRLKAAISAIKKQLRALAGDRAREDKKFASLLLALGAAYEKVWVRYRAIRSADLRSIHRTRVAFKKFRYMMEALYPLLPDVPARQLQAMHDYQTRMGDIQDVEVLLAGVDAFVKKQRPKGAGWDRFRDELLRRRADRVEQFMASADELLEYYSLEAVRSARHRAAQSRRF